MQKKILLAEDDWDDQHFFYKFLQSRKDLVLLPAVENGEALFEFLESREKEEELPDAIVLDQNMPRRNGLQTLALLKENSRYAHIPVMIYSTYINDTLTRQGVSAGAALVMPKPADAAGYQRMIDELFRVVK